MPSHSSRPSSSVEQVGELGLLGRAAAPTRARTIACARAGDPLGRRQVEQPLQHGVDHRAAGGRGAGPLGQPVDDPEAVEQRAGHEVAGPRRRQRRRAGRLRLGRLGQREPVDRRRRSACGRDGRRCPAPCSCPHSTTDPGHDPGAPRPRLRWGRGRRTGRPPRGRDAPGEQPSARSSDGRIVLARPFGVPVDVTPAWFLVAALITWGFGATVESSSPGSARGGTPSRWRSRCCSTLSVLVHELSHTFLALRSGLPVRRISLHVLGGVSEIERPADTPGREAGIAAGRTAGVAAAGGRRRSSSGRPLEPGTVVPAARLGARCSATCWSALFNLLPGPAARRRAGAVGRGLGATGRRHTGTVVAGWAGRVARRAGPRPRRSPLRRRCAVSPHARRRGLGRAARHLHLGRRQPGDPRRAVCRSGCPASPPAG